MQKYNANLVEKNRLQDAKKQEKLQNLSTKQKGKGEPGSEEAMEVDQATKPSTSWAPHPDFIEKDGKFVYAKKEQKQNEENDPKVEPKNEEMKADEEEEKVTVIEPAQSSFP